MKGRKKAREFESVETPVNTLRRGLLLVVVMASIALTVHEIFGENGWLALRQQRRRVQAIQHQIRNLKQQNEQLQKDIHGLKRDPQTIERYAREQMHFARPGEIIYTFPAQKPATSNSSAAAQNTIPKK